MQKHEIFTSQEGLDLLDFINFQVEQSISLARGKGHKYYAYSLEFRVDEQRGDGYIVMPIIKDYSAMTLDAVKEHCKDWRFCDYFAIDEDGIRSVDVDKQN